MHLLVLSAFRRLFKLGDRLFVLFRLNAPFGAQCFPTEWKSLGDGRYCQVSMHLLVLSAFRLRGGASPFLRISRLNAPFGAQCFPTESGVPGDDDVFRLNAPFGAQCFPTKEKNVP